MIRPRYHLLAASLVVVALHSRFQAAARANGAFPDSLQLLLPANKPQQIIVSTTFGLIISDDDGQTWSWTCEQMNTTNAGLYQLGPPPQSRLYGISSEGLAYSDDESCSWSLAAGSLSKTFPSDVFVDPSDAQRVLAIALPDEPEIIPEEVYVSEDGGTTFGASLFKAPVQGGLTGVEIARSDPKIVYLAMYTTPGLHPKLVRSTDGGVTWDPPLDLEPMLGNSPFRLIGIDPVNPQKLFLRVQGPLQDMLAISEDGGHSFHIPVMADNLTAFVRMNSGTILVTGLAEGGTAGYRSTDGGKTFQRWTNAPGVRALAERSGKLYISADNFKDGFALAVSTDEGATLHPLMTFDKVASIRPCAQAACLASCEMQVGLKLWPAATCHPKPPMPPPKSGCSVAAVSPFADVRAFAPLGLFALVFAWRLGSRRRR